MKHLSILKLSLCIVCSLNIPTLSAVGAGSKTGPSMRPVTLPEALEEETINLKDEVAQGVQEMLQALGIQSFGSSIDFNTQAQRHAQEFIGQFTIERTLKTLSADQQITAEDITQAIATISFSSCITSNKNVLSPAVPASLEEVTICLTDHIQTMMMITGRLDSLTQDFHHYLMTALPKLALDNQQVRQQELAATFDMMISQQRTVLRETFGVYMQQCIVYTTALWVAEKLSAHDLRIHLDDQKKNMLIQLSTPFLTVKRLLDNILMAIEAQKAQPQTAQR